MSDEKTNGSDDPGRELALNSNVSSFFGALGDGVLATFDPKTPDGARLLVLSTLADIPPIKEALNKEIAVQHVYSNPASRIDPTTGALEEWRRVVLIDDKGNAWDCGSRGIGKSLGIIALCRGNPPWIPAVNCTERVQDLGNSRQWYTLVPDMASIGANVAAPRRAR